MTTHPVSRRTVLTGLVGLGAAAAGLSGCSSKATLAGPDAAASAEALRPTTGRVRNYRLQARRTEIDLGGRVVPTWTYGDALPGVALRATAGDRMRIAFTNDLPEETSVHWHGLAIRNDMDGVPGLTMPPVKPGGHFAFDFVVPHAGTHWLHPHTGLQLDRGLYAPFIVDDPSESGEYDTEWVVVLDDWTDGIGPSPEQILAKLKTDGTSSGGMGGMGSGGMADMGSGGMGSGGMGSGGMGSGDSGDVTYPLYLVNGRPPTDPNVLHARPGQRVRLRIINAAADTIFDVALGGHQLHVSHTDGYPVTPVITSALRIGMGERYDAVVTLQDGVFPLVAEAVGKKARGRALVRTGSGRPPAAAFRPTEFDGTPLTVSRLQTRPGGALPRRTPDSVQDLVLGGSMTGYTWTINGRTYDRTRPLTVRQGQTTRLKIRNATMMTHPIHVHGHTFQLGSAGGTGPRKDTVLIPAMGSLDVDLLADNPGRWMVHCHNAYHAEAGMMTRLDYLT
jgi:FtsP/CotA-like multicopper oxidase with cupredoxin domain